MSRALLSAMLGNQALMATLGGRVASGRLELVLAFWRTRRVRATFSVVVPQPVVAASVEVQAGFPSLVKTSLVDGRSA